MGSCARPKSSRRLRSLPWSTGLCRLSPVPAGRWPFPALSLQSLRRCSAPYPAVSSWCKCSLLPRRRRPHPESDEFGTLKIYPVMQLQQGSCFRGCRHSIIFGLPRSLGLQVAPTAGARSLPGGQDVYTTHSPVGYLPRGVVSLRVRHEQLTRRDFHPLDCSLAGCSLIHRTSGRCPFECSTGSLPAWSPRRRSLAQRAGRRYGCLLPEAPVRIG
jgi:hypothetical protein